MPTSKHILLAILYTAVCRIAVEVFMTTWTVWNTLNKEFRGHNALYGICTSATSLSDDLDLYCRVAKDALDDGFPLAFTRAVLRKTKWCLGYECSLSVPIQYWGFAFIGIMLNLRVIWSMYRWCAAAPERKRDRFLRNAIKAA